MLMDHRKIVARLAWSCLLSVRLVLCAPLLWLLNGRTLWLRPQGEDGERER